MRRAVGRARFQQRRAGGERGGYVRQVVLLLLNSETRIWLHLDGDRLRSSRRVDHVALVDETETDAAADRAEIVV